MAEKYQIEINTYRFSIATVDDENSVHKILTVDKEDEINNESFRRIVLNAFDNTLRQKIIDYYEDED